MYVLCARTTQANALPATHSRSVDCHCVVLRCVCWQSFNGNYSSLDTGGMTTINFTLVMRDTVNGASEREIYDHTYWIGNATNNHLFPCVATPPPVFELSNFTTYHMRCNASSGYGPYPGLALYALYSSAMGMS